MQSRLGAAAGGPHEPSTALFNHAPPAPIVPEETFLHEYELAIDSPRRVEWFFHVEDSQQGGGGGTGAVEFWCEALWELEEGGARTNTIHPPRQFAAGQA